MYKCSECGSEDTFKVSQIYASSTQFIDTTTLGGGITNIGGGLGAAATKGTIQSLRAQQISPPQKPKENTALGCGILLFIIIITFSLPITFLSLLLLIGGFILAWKSMKPTKVDLQYYEMAYNKWNTKWICNRCGNIFIPENTS